MTEIKYKKKLIEVALPLDAIDKESMKDSSITVGGHPSTFHKWWARRPLAACRAVIFASLVDDPSNHFSEKKAKKERERLFKLMEKLILWKNVNNLDVLEEAKKEIRKSVGKEMPMLLDPFCGGGSIPLEAQRLGLKVSASDLNPVATIITKAMIEIYPKFSGNDAINPGSLENTGIKDSHGVGGIISDIEYYAKLINNDAQKKIGNLYPKINNNNVIAWIWARTVECSNPACGAEIPLVKSFQLHNDKGNKIIINPKIDEKTKKVLFEIKKGKNNPLGSTINGKVGAKCLLCPHTTKMKHITDAGKNGKLKQKLMGIIVEGKKGREYLSAEYDSTDYSKIKKPEFVPGLEIPYNGRYLTVPQYGIKTFSDLFTSRQLTALTTFRDLILNYREKIIDDALKAGFDNDDTRLDDGGKGATAYADAIITYIAFIFDRCVHSWSSFSFWANSFIVPTYARQALAMVWDFAEANPFSNSTGNWSTAIIWITNAMRKFPVSGNSIVDQVDATKSLFNNTENPIICTDPPYYDNIGYADLSDYFYVWLRSILDKTYPKLFRTVLTPKSTELVVSKDRFGDKKSAEEFFINGMEDWFKLIRKNSNEDFPITMFYAYKQETKEEHGSDKSFSSTGWETMLHALISSGLQITGTWPIKTENSKKLKGKINALASSIVLVCRPRNEEATMINRKDFVKKLKTELPIAIDRLLQGSVSPVDLSQCAIGPGMTIFSRYSQIIEADGKKMTVKTALQIINRELDSILNSQESELDSNSRFCVAWFEQHGTNDGPYGDAELLTIAKNTSVESLSTSRLVESGHGKVKLLQWSEINDTSIDEIEELSVWYCMQLLIKALQEDGESGVCEIIKQIGVGQSELGKELAYLMYSICDKKKWTDDAFVFNNLITSWSSIQEKIDLPLVKDGQRRL